MKTHHKLGAIPDGFCFSQEALEAGNDAVGAWARMLFWSLEHESHGVVPVCVADTIAGDDTLEVLLGVGLLKLTQDGNFEVNHIKRRKAR